MSDARVLFRAMNVVRVAEPGWRNVFRYLGGEDAIRWTATQLGVTRSQLMRVALGREDFAADVWLRAEAVLGVPAVVLQKHVPGW